MSIINDNILPTVADLDSDLKDLADWNLFGIHLRGMKASDIAKIKKENQNNVNDCKIALYTKWLKVCDDATWSDIVTALEEIEEKLLAKNIAKSRLPLENTLQAVSLVEKVLIFPAQEEDELVEELEGIRSSFTKLLQDTLECIREKVNSGGDIALQQITTNISLVQLDILQDALNCSTLTELFKIINSSCNFLDASILETLVKSGLRMEDTELHKRTKEHLKNVRIFQRKAPIKMLKNQIRQQLPPDNTTILTIQLNDAWDKKEIELVEKLVIKLAGIENGKPKLFQVKSGSIYVMYLMKEKVLIKMMADKIQFLHLTGVCGLQLGEESIFEENENRNYTFEFGLLEASKIGNLEAVNFILKLAININHSDETGATPLMLASKHGHCEIVNCLIENGANVNIQDNKGHTAVMLAKSVEIYKSFVNANADMNIVTHQGLTSLYFSCITGNYDVANHLLFNLQHETTTRPNGLTLLMAASCGGNDKIAKYLLENGADPNVQDKNGNTAIGLACLKGQYTIAELLLKHNAISDMPNKDHWTPLMNASYKGHYDIAILLLRNGVDPNVQDNYGITAIHLACLQNHLTIVELLLQNCANPNISDENGWTPLMSVSMNGNCKIVDLLLGDVNFHPITNNQAALIKCKADPNIQHKHGETAIWFACLNDHYEVVELLLKHNANPNVLNSEGWTPLMNASNEGQPRIVKLLLSNEADPNIQSTAYGRTALMYASQNGHNKTVKILLMNNVDPNIQDVEEFTAMHLACANQHYEIIELLLQHSTNLNMPNNNGWTPLMVASHKGYCKIIELLLNNGVDPNCGNSTNGITALILTSETGCYDATEMLIKHGAYTDIPDGYGRTAIHCACVNGHHQIVKLLLQHNANPTLCDDNGLTPLMAASRSGHSIIVDLLLQYGVGEETKEVTTSLIIASECGHDEIVQLLLTCRADLDFSDSDYNEARMLATRTEYHPTSQVEHTPQVESQLNLVQKQHTIKKSEMDIREKYGYKYGYNY